MHNFKRAFLSFCLLAITFMLGACNPINKSTIIAGVSKNLPDGFVIKNVKILNEDKHYDYEGYPAIDFDVMYTIAATKDMYKQESTEPHIQNNDITVRFVSKVFKKGDTFSYMSSGSLKRNQRYKRNELSASCYVEPKYGKSKDDLSKNTTGFVGNQKKEFKVEVLEIGSKEELAYKNLKSNLFSNASKNLLGCWKGSNNLKIYAKNNVLFYGSKKYSLHVGKINGEWSVTPRLGFEHNAFGKPYLFRELSDNKYVLYQKGTSGLGTVRFQRIRTEKESIAYANTLKKNIVGTWLYVKPKKEKKGIDKVKYRFNSNGTYIRETNWSSNEITTETGSWASVFDGIIEITNSKDKTISYLCVYEIDSKTMNLGNMPYKKIN